MIQKFQTINCLVLICSLNGFSQQNDLNKDYLKGDWFYWEKIDFECRFDSNYCEAAFFDSYFENYNHCNDLDYSYKYSLDGDTIKLYSLGDTISFNSLQVDIIAPDTFHITNQDGKKTFYRLHSKYYTLKQYQKDNMALHQLELYIPRRIKTNMRLISQEYYYECAKLREYELRLQRNEITKKEAVKWAEFRKDLCRNNFEMKKYDEFINMVKSSY